ncbi:MAG: hypothetical protein HXL35_07645 [Prevotellaceae bacterium]|nr:hypothetical protein [Prevotellaceae bacterium]
MLSTVPPLLSIGLKTFNGRQGEETVACCLPSGSTMPVCSACREQAFMPFTLQLYP